MKYMGSKARHSKEMLPIILDGRTEGQWYVEPFVGGGNMIDKVSGNRMGNDIHPQLIALLESVSNGWVPPTDVDEDEYRMANLSRAVDAMVGFIGFGCSYSGKWFGGYARGDDAKGKPRNYAAESSRNLVRQASGLRGVRFSCGPYQGMHIPPNSIIYCDPPYRDTTKYASGAFDHDEFWAWCDAKSDEGHMVFVSEYSAPDGWECVWEKTVNNTLTKNTGSKQGTERLFRRLAK